MRVIHPTFNVVDVVVDLQKILSAEQKISQRQTHKHNTIQAINVVFNGKQQYIYVHKILLKHTNTEDPTTYSAFTEILLTLY